MSNIVRGRWISSFNKDFHKNELLNEPFHKNELLNEPLLPKVSVRKHSD